MYIKNDMELKDLLKDGRLKDITLEQEFVEFEASIQYNSKTPHKIFLVMYNYDTGVVTTVNSFAGFADFFYKMEDVGFKIRYEQ